MSVATEAFTPACLHEECDQPAVALGLCEKHCRPSRQSQKVHESKRKLNRSCSKCGGAIPHTSRYGAIFCSKACKTAAGNLSRALRSYDITLDQYEALLLAQEHRCAICRTHKDKLTKRLAIDHNHETGAVRGLLCSTCNTGLGHFKDSAAVLCAAIAYLER